MEGPTYTRKSLTQVHCGSLTWLKYHLRANTVCRGRVSSPPTDRAGRSRPVAVGRPDGGGRGEEGEEGPGRPSRRPASTGVGPLPPAGREDVADGRLLTIRPTTVTVTAEDWWSESGGEVERELKRERGSRRRATLTTPSRNRRIDSGRLRRPGESGHVGTRLGEFRRQ